MKKTLSILLAMALLMTMLGALGGAAVADGAKDYSGVTIRMANHVIPGTSEENDYQYEVFTRVANEMGFKLEIEGVAGDELRNKIKVDAAANNLPDLFKFWAGGVMADYVEAGMVQDVSDYIAVSKSVKEENYPESAWLTSTFDGVRYAVPFQQGIACFLANKDIFEECGVEIPVNGWTYDEFIAASKKFTEKGYATTNVGSLGGNPSHFFYGDFVCQYNDGNDLTANIGKDLQFDNPTFRKACGWIEKMRDEGVFPSDTVAAGDWTPSCVFYLEGKSALCYTFGWAFRNFEDHPEMVDKSVCVTLPKLPDSDRDPTTFTQGTVNDCYMISKAGWADELKRDCITALLDVYFSEIELTAGQKGWRVPVDKSILAQLDYSTDPTIMGKVMTWRIKDSVEGSPMIWQCCPNNQTQFDYQSYMDELWAGTINTDEYMKKVQQSFDEYRDDL